VLPRLIATDLDGTLLDPTGVLTARSAAALQAAADAGVVVVFASGRPPFFAAREIEVAGNGVHYGVMANGTIVCTLPDGGVLHHVTYPAALARAAVVALRAYDPELRVGLATDRGFTAEEGFRRRMPIDPGGEAVADALVGHEDATEAIKLFAFHPVLDAHTLLRELPAVLGGELAVGHMGADAVEIAPAGADKGRGLQWLCRHLGIDSTEVTVFGDEVNDLPMFGFAGRRVAVGNANPAVREAADEVCGPNSADGVAEFIEQLLADG
jgi:Cof subfamily protein (haloacid dehalogenase superfamily)